PFLLGEWQAVVERRSGEKIVGLRVGKQHEQAASLVGYPKAAHRRAKWHAAGHCHHGPPGRLLLHGIAKVRAQRRQSARHRPLWRGEQRHLRQGRRGRREQWERWRRGQSAVKIENALVR